MQLLISTGSKDICNIVLAQGKRMQRKKRVAVEQSVAQRPERRYCNFQERLLKVPISTLPMAIRLQSFHVYRICRLHRISVTIAPRCCHVIK